MQPGSDAANDAETPTSAQPGAVASLAAGPQASAAAIPREAPDVAPSVLTAGQAATLAAALNRIIPAHGNLPGAGELGVGDAIDRTLFASPALRRLFLDGLAGLDATASAPGGFVALDTERQDGTLRTAEATRPAFFAALVDHAYRGYYTLPAVHAAIGYASRPPQPLGYRLAPFDPALLQAQRRRAPFWRPAK